LSDDASLRSGFVALLGWTNVGKSTLLNRLVGAKLAAVADVAQTTRTRICGALSVPGRGQILFLDTPGLHEPRHRMNRAMVESAERAAADVDVAVLVLDAARGAGAGDRRVAERIIASGRERVAVLNKVDLVRPKSRLLPLIERLAREWNFERVVPLSAASGEGCAALIDELFPLLPASAPLYPEDYLTDQPERALAAEWIREKLLQHTRQELPHATAVHVERWTRREDGLVSIEAVIFVERESQKRIVIGAGGELLKRVGSAARHDLEQLLEGPVFLRLWVKVREDWRDDERALRELGLA